MSKSQNFRSHQQTQHQLQPVSENLHPGGIFSFSDLILRLRVDERLKAHKKSCGFENTHVHVERALDASPFTVHTQ